MTAPAATAMKKLDTAPVTVGICGERNGDTRRNRDAHAERPRRSSATLAGDEALPGISRRRVESAEVNAAGGDADPQPLGTTNPMHQAAGNSAEPRMQMLRSSRRRTVPPEGMPREAAIAAEAEARRRPFIAQGRPPGPADAAGKSPNKAPEEDGRQVGASTRRNAPTPPLCCVVPLYSMSDVLAPRPRRSAGGTSPISCGVPRS